MNEHDFIDYKVINKTDIEGLPAQEIYLVYDYTRDLWIYEFYDNNDWNLRNINGQGTVFDTQYSGSDIDPDELMAGLALKYPNAIITRYERYDDWIHDHAKGVRK